ncbi:hypothetical protein Msi02_79250 [Microbispora siamensis]|uniref:Uncharacterized protein n=1 Tax=Microbispora siamensis TaxID=564413 RepID=A0ABQ4H0C7_9ACTN|nr:hypothetical protein Msi02_79250 [Microbispora siamensis]
MSGPVTPPARHLPRGAQAHDPYGDAIERGLLIGEVAAGLGRPADAGMDRLDRFVEQTIKIKRRSGHTISR